MGPPVLMFTTPRSSCTDCVTTTSVVATHWSTSVGAFSSTVRLFTIPGVPVGTSGPVVLMLPMYSRFTLLLNTIGQVVLPSGVREKSGLDVFSAGATTLKPLQNSTPRCRVSVLLPITAGAADTSLPMRMSLDSTSRLNEPNVLSWNRRSAFEALFGISRPTVYGVTPTESVNV